jgi:hypothetical protein
LEFNFFWSTGATVTVGSTANIAPDRTLRIACADTRKSSTYEMADKSHRKWESARLAELQKWQKNSLFW